MAKKDKKSGDKKAKLAEKKARQEKKAEKKSKSKAAKMEGSDAEDVDLDEVLAEYQRAQEQFLKITEVVADEPPKPRAASCFLASPSNSNQLLLFGGEYFNGALATFFNDLHVYYIDKDLWKTVTSPNAPLPRSGHAWCRGGNQAQYVYLFGGEFSSPKQGTFYHYNDFWRLEPNTREWTRLEPKGKCPPARSGHRMTYFKQYVVLFGGFQDTSSSTKYLADLWLYDTLNFVWFQPVLPPAQLKPDARSSFTLLPHEQGAVLFGGYSRVKATSGGGGGSGGGKGKGGGGPGAGRNVLRPMVHQDCFFLRITPPAAGSTAPPTVRWERRKKPANAPEPKRAGATMAYHKGRGIMFGGVHDVEESEEGMDSEFFNGLFAWNVERNRFFPLALRKPRAQKKGGGGGGGGDERVGRRGRAQAKEEELLRQLAALETGKSIEEAEDIVLEEDGDKKKKRNGDDDEDEDDRPVREMPVSMEMPHPRFNAQLAVQDDVLYIYGGTFEKGDREFTFDDMYAVDLGKMDGCKEVFSRVQTEDWIVSVAMALAGQVIHYVDGMLYRATDAECLFRSPRTRRTMRTTTKMRTWRTTKRRKRKRTSRWRTTTTPSSRPASARRSRTKHPMLALRRPSRQQLRQPPRKRKSRRPTRLLRRWTTVCRIPGYAIFSLSEQESTKLSWSSRYRS